jgi:hypothetical protein
MKAFRREARMGSVRRAALNHNIDLQADNRT